MRLLRRGHPDVGRGPPGAQTRADGSGGARRPRSQLVPVWRAQSHGARGAPRGQRGGVMTAELPINLAANPRLSRWLRFDAAGFVEVSPGKIEIGQGIVTALAQIAADELDVSLERVRMRPVSTAVSPNEGTTSGSLSVEQSGSAVRHAAAEARAIDLTPAAQRLGVSSDSLSIEDGTIIGPGNLRTSYWELANPALLERDASPAATVKAPAARRIAGTAVARLDFPDKVFGRPRFVHDLTLPGLVHGRVLKPAAPGARLLSLPADARSEEHTSELQSLRHLVCR